MKKLYWLLIVLAMLFPINVHQYGGEETVYGWITEKSGSDLIGMIFIDDKGIVILHKSKKIYKPDGSVWYGTASWYKDSVSGAASRVDLVQIVELPVFGMTTYTVAFYEAVVSPDEWGEELLILSLIER